MAHITSHISGTVDAHNTFLVIFKIHGDALLLFPQERMKAITQTHKLRVSCHNVDSQSAEDPCEDIQYMILSEPPANDETCQFQPQHPAGQELTSIDLITFMTAPVSSARKTSYAFDISLSPKEPLEGELLNEFVGTAYVYLDPKFSSQGCQRTPIIATNNRRPIGQIQVDYLIVTNPVGFGVEGRRPNWLSETSSPQAFAGHRGAGSGRRLDLPDRPLENTIASFNFAHRNGADFCELDVFVSADGVPVVYHDFDVDAVTAHQSSEQLGKFRVQANEFTVEQLRDFRLLSLHDDHGAEYRVNVAKQPEEYRPFPTLAEVLQQVDQTCGLNIEIKWPQMLENGKMEARKYREINDFVERVIDVVQQYGKNRRIVLESFEPDLVVMLRLKQDRFPVFFLSQAMTDHYDRYMDIRTRSVTNGVYFAEAFDLAGIDIILDYYMMGGRKLVNFINDHNLVARAWGDLGSDMERLTFLKKLGLQCITCDKVDLVTKRHS